MKPENEKKKPGNKPGRKARASDLANLRKAQGKQTGPKTQEGKDIVSMNAVDSGLYVKKFHRIGKYAGELALCEKCGEEQKAICKEKQLCELQGYFVTQSILARDEHKPEYLEDANIVSLSYLRVLFESRLKYAIEHVDEMMINKKTLLEKHVIDTKYIEILFDMAEKLGISMEHMMLTRKTMDSSDAAWANMAKEHIERDKAKEYLQKLSDGFDRLLNINDRAEENRQGDTDLKEYNTSIGNNDEPDEELDLGAVGESPFPTK